MPSKQLVCHFEPGLFPMSEFMMDENGAYVFPYIHIARKPFHYTNGQLVPSTPNPDGSPLPDFPNIPSLYIPIVPAMVERFNRVLEKYLQDREEVTLNELLDFGRDLDLEIRDLDLKNLIDLNLNGIPKDILNDAEKLVKHFRERRGDRFSLGHFETGDSGLESGGDDFGGPGGFGGLGSGGGLG